MKTGLEYQRHSYHPPHSSALLSVNSPSLRFSVQASEHPFWVHCSGEVLERMRKEWGDQDWVLGTVPGEYGNDINFASSSCWNCNESYSVSLPKMIVLLPLSNPESHVLLYVTMGLSVSSEIGNWGSLSKAVFLQGWSKDPLPQNYSQMPVKNANFWASLQPYQTRLWWLVTGCRCALWQALPHDLHEHSSSKADEQPKSRCTIKAEKVCC